MTKTIKLFAFLAIAFCLPVFEASGTDLDNGLESLNKNDYRKAIDYFKTATAGGGADALEARLWLTILREEYFDFEKFTENFSDFIDKHEYPDPYVFALWFSFIRVYNNPYYEEKVADYLESLIESERIKGVARIYILEGLTGYYRKRYEFKKAKKYAAMIGGITSWQAVGVFENISASGFEKNYPPIAHPEPDFVFEDKNKADVKWFDMVAPINGKWISFWNNFDIKSSVMYAQSFCTSPVGQDVQFRIGTSGSLKVWINDKLVMSEEEERNNGIDTYIANIKLNAGNNRILLQLGSSEITSSNFYARICDSGGKPISGLSFRSAYSHYEKSGEYDSKPIPNEYEEYFSEKMKAAPDKLIYRVLLAKCLLTNDKSNEARELILESQKLFKDNAVLYSLLIEAYYRMDNNTDYSLAKETYKRLVPELPSVLLQEFEEAMDNEKYNDARYACNKYEKYSYDAAEVWSMRIRLAVAEKKNEEIGTYIFQAYEQYPYDLRMISYRLILEKSMSSDPRSIIRIIKNYTDRYNESAALSILAKLYMELGKKNDCIEIYTDRLENEPENLEIYYNIAEIFFDSRDYSKALEYYKICSELAPYSASVHYLLGNTYRELMKNSEANNAYKTAIKYNPFHYSAREQLRKIENKKVPREYFTEPDLYKIFDDNLKKEFKQTDDAVILCDHINKIVYNGGATEEYHYMLIKLVSNNGIDYFKEFPVFHYYNQDFTIEKAEVLKKTGERLKAETNDDMVYFTKLSEGDAVLLIYKIQNYQYGSLSSYFWGKESFYYYFPSLDTKFSLLISPNEPFNYVVSNSGLKPAKQAYDDYVMYTWQIKDQEKVKYEKYTPAKTTFLPVLDYSSIPSWAVINNWYMDIYKTKSKAFYEVKQVVADLFKDNKKLTEMEKCKRIYNYIVNNIRYSSVDFRQSGVIPQKASTTLNTRMGDCKDVSTLFIAMCSEVGIKADLVLVSTSSYGKNNLPLPSTDFNHAIASVTADGRKYYVELTTDLQPFGAIHDELLGALGLEIRENFTDSLFVINPPGRMQNSIIRNINVNFENDRMNVGVRTVKTGGISMQSRSSYKNKSQDEQRKVIVSAINKDYPGSKLIDISFVSGLDAPDDSIVYKYSYYVDNVFNKIANFSSFKVPYEDFLYELSSLSDEERKTPYGISEVYDFDEVRDELEIRIPQGKMFAEIPANVSLGNEFGEYSLNYILKGNVLYISRRLAIKKEVALPSEFSKFREFMISVNNADTKLMAFTDEVKAPVNTGKKKGR
mgnify:CR=1 FL=1